jgi:hypothetical protein
MVNLKRLERLEKRFSHTNGYIGCLLQFKAGGCLTKNEQAMLDGERLSFADAFYNDSLSDEQLQQRKGIRAAYKGVQPPLSFCEMYDLPLLL